MASLRLDPAAVLPADGTQGTLVGRVWRPEREGPSVAAIRADGGFDVNEHGSTMRVVFD
jgi:fumarylacetoacetate (FAA) hydrolase family protein